MKSDKSKPPADKHPRNGRNGYSRRDFLKSAGVAVPTACWTF